MSKNDGGQAFPAAVPDNAFHEIGMTLRDYFAAKALQGICAHVDSWGCGNNSAVADCAYKLADAMLSERIK